MIYPLRLALDRSVRSLDQDGRLHVGVSNISKATVDGYLGRELPGWESLGVVPDRVYPMLRPPEELARAADTFSGIPILSEHRPVSAANHPPELVIGSTGRARFEDPWLKADLVFWPQAAIDLIESGRQRDLSCGYAFRPVMESGHFRGEPYAGRMVDLTGNHLALVCDGRVEGAIVADASPFTNRRPKLRHHNTFRGIFLAADAAVRRRRARDAELSDAELDNERADTDDLIQIIAEWLRDMGPEAGREFLSALKELTDSGDPEMAAEIGADRGRRARDGLPLRGPTVSLSEMKAGDRRRLAGDSASAHSFYRYYPTVAPAGYSDEGYQDFLKRYPGAARQ